jgi:hypothetical protein
MLMNRRVKLISMAAVVCLAVALAFTLAAASTSATSSLTSGKAQLTSAGPLAFGPDGVLFVGDSIGGQVVALDTGDHTAPRSDTKINVQGVDMKIAAVAGVAPDQVVINDMKVNPISKNVYLSASRGLGPDAMPLIVRVNAAGDVSLLSLENIPHSSVSLTDAPKPDASARQNPRMLTITDMNYVNGSLMVAGLSNEEWSSALRSIPYPFKKAEEGATLQIWHASHGRYETQAPVRTFVPYTIQGQQYVLAAYTCTPLVKIPVSDLKPGAKVKGVTIADLGSGNQPLDMVPYNKNGHDYILVANTSLGVLKLKADSLESYKPIDSPTVTDVAGVPYDSLRDLKNVRQLAQLDSSNAVILAGKSGPLNIQTIALP